MGKKRSAKSVEDEKPEIYCFYCDREFDDEKVLILHQKAKHFKCDICHKKLSTAGGLVVHVIQVHKENITEIPGALPDKKSVEFEIYGMSGIPDEFLRPGAKARRDEEDTAAAAAAAVPSNARPFGGYPPASSQPGGYFMPAMQMTGPGGFGPPPQGMMHGKLFIGFHYDYIVVLYIAALSICMF